jgi:uncharacterized protein (DUF362 family)
MPSTTIHITKTSPFTLREDIHKIIDRTDFARWRLGSPTFIKINGNYDRYYPGSNTSPWFLDALLSALRKKGFENLTVVEGDLPYFTADQMIHRTGLVDILKRYDVPFVNYQSMERDENNIPRMLLNAQVINTPVPHGHGFAVISCAVKNLFGLLPNPRRKYHRVLSETILKLAEKIRPFTIVDATVGLVGPSTRRGKPVRMDLVLAGWDPVAVDVVLTKMMKYEVHDIPHLKMASERGLVSEINLEGDYEWDTLPSFDWLLKIDVSRRFAAFLESTWLESWMPFQWVENRLERLYHHLTYLLKRKQLFNGPWMEYEKCMKSRKNE